MNSKALKIVKIAVSVASIGVTLASGYLSEKDQDKKIAKKVAEALAEKTKEEA